MIKKTAGFLLTPFFLLFFFSTLVFFHPLLVIADKFLGYKYHMSVLKLMNKFILFELQFIGTKFIISLPYDLPRDRPVIIVSNHQSMFDIPLILINFTELDPKFIAKVELSRGIPSISYALRNMGSAIIDRKDQKKAIETIERFADSIKAKKIAACIFPEGTRARDGKLKKFKSAGLHTLIKKMPEAVIVPLVISGSWELLRYNFWPVPFGTKVYLKMLPPVDKVSDYEAKDLCLKIESLIAGELSNLCS